MSGSALLMGIGVTSILCCLFPILTYALFPDLRNLRYIELVFYISVNDLVATIGATLPLTPDGSASCWFQGLTTNFNFLSSAMWTVVIAYQLFLVTHYGKLLDEQHMFRFHILCWGVPLLATLLPLTTSTYGDADDSISEWCVIRSSSPSSSVAGKAWTIAGFYLWLWISVLAMLYFLVQVGRRFQQMGDSLAPVVRSSLNKLSLYPAIIVSCWLLPSIADMTQNFAPSVDFHTPAMRSLAFLSYVTPLLQGVLLSLVFTLRNPIVRDRWRVAIASTILAIAPRLCPSLTKPTQQQQQQQSYPSSSSAAGLGPDSNNNNSWKNSRWGYIGCCDCVAAKIGAWLSRGDDLVAVHIRAENEGDYSSRASVATTGSRSSTRSASSTFARLRKSALGALGLRTDGAGNDIDNDNEGVGGDGDGMERGLGLSPASIIKDIIPAAGAAQLYGARVSSPLTTTVAGSSPPIFPGAFLGSASPSASAYGSYFSSGSLDAVPMGSSGMLSSKTISFTASTSFTPSLASTPSTAPSGTSLRGSGGSSSLDPNSLSLSSFSSSSAASSLSTLAAERTGSGRLLASAGSPTNFSNAPSSRVGSGIHAAAVTGSSGGAEGRPVSWGQMLNADALPENPIFTRR